MGLFSRLVDRADLRHRDYVLTGCPVVAQDGVVVLVDVTVRLTVRPPRDDGDPVLGYDPAYEPAVHAVAVLVLRQLGAAMPSDELLVGRARVVQAVEEGLALAPVGAGVDARVVSTEVRPHDRHSAPLSHEFRLAAGA
jgi:regulator of protease activity HflC (stomatin/prohibitin superfamily)